MIEYDILDDYLQQSEADAGAAEVHGAFCGALCASGALTQAQWHDLVFSQKAQNHEAQTDKAQMRPELFELLKDMYHDMVQGLNDSDLGFELLMPDETEELSYRVNALGEWCNGFLFGLSVGGVKDIEELPEQVIEVVEDFLAISQVSADGMEENEVEAQMMEVMEYLRVSALLVNEELQPQRQLPASMRQDAQLH